MCSVVGYVGNYLSQSRVIEGLSRLEYRGYDSAGYACLDSREHTIRYAKATGTLDRLTSKLDEFPIDGYIGIGHTRWSSHGPATDQNAHPHVDCFEQISVVHNGIIENHAEIRVALTQAGHTFRSDTDTEVIAHLFEDFLVQHSAATLDDLTQYIQHITKQLRGAYALLIVMKQFPEVMIAIRNRSPLCVGIGQHESYVASDAYAFAGHVNQVVYIPDRSFAFVHKEHLQMFDFSGNPLPILTQPLDLRLEFADKNGHPHYMLKEIFEQKGAIQQTIEYLNNLGDHLWQQCGVTADFIKQLNKINMTACGTSWHAARIAQFFFESIALIPTSVHLASEFRHMPLFADQKSLSIAISQSGETADTLEALSLLRQFKQTTLALTNSHMSTMVRAADGYLLTKAGKEVAVASTKAFTTQLIVLFWLAHRIALEKGIITHMHMAQAIDAMLCVAEVLENTIYTYQEYISAVLAPRYAQYKKAIFLGRHCSYPFAMEAALKLKELSYIFSQCYPAGELKHGPLALIDQETPVFVFSCLDPVVYQKLVINVSAAKARHAHIVAFVCEDQKELKELADTIIEIPRVHPLLFPVAMTGVMQYFVYSIAHQLGRPIDKPRNLAKSVTVE